MNGLLTRARLRAIVVAFTLAAGCGDSTAPPVPSALTPVGSQSITATVNSPQQVSLRVTDSKGKAVRNVPVAWAVTSGGGSISPQSARTDASGEVQATWTLGTAAGSNTATASVQGLSPATFSATGTPAAPATVKATTQPPASAAVGSALSPLPAVRVEDAYGNGVPGVQVSFAATGGGTIVGTTRTTDAQGIAAVQLWELGPAVGTQELTASVASLPPATFQVNAVAAAPSSVSVKSGADQSAVVGTAVAAAPQLVVLDHFANPVPGVTVTFTVAAGGGSIERASQVTDEQGVAGPGTWTLGTTAGTQMLSVTAATVQTTITATATPGPAAAMLRHEGDAQSMPPGAAVTVPPAVRIQDAYGNGIAGIAVTFSVTAGGGSITGAQHTTNANGVARVASWTLGTAGTNSLTATATGLAPVTFNALADGSAFNLAIDAVHLNQGNQTRTGTNGSVAGRPGVLRVVVRANVANAHQPPVRLRLYQNGSLLREILLAAPEGGVRIDPDLGTLAHTYNLMLPGAEVVSGLGVEAVVDPDQTISEAERGDNRFPREGGVHSLDVAPLYPLRIVFFPVHATAHSLTTSFNAGNLDSYLVAPRQWTASASIVTSIRPTYTTGHDLSTGAGWSTLLSEIQAIRTAESAVDQYYHAMVPYFAAIAYGGLAYLPPSPASGFRSGVSYDALPRASETIAHELGHNLGRPHAPCGNPGGPDPNYPHAGAVLGSPGFDILAGAVMNATNLRDYMSYCAPRWTSDYTFGKIVEWRRADPLGQQGDVAASRARTGGLLVFGRIGADGVILNPAFALEAAPALPEGRGENLIRGVARDGRELFSYAFEGVPVEDGADPTERHFSFFIPLGAAQIDALESIEVSAARASARAMSSASAQSVGAPEALIGHESDQRLRVRWDAGSYPMALVRDAATGHIVSFVRGGDARVVAPQGGRLEVLLSDGVKSRRAVLK